MTFTIRKDVPIPTAQGYRSKYPFGIMTIGDSFVLSEEQVESVRRAAYAFSRRNRGIYRVRQGDDGQWACWRLA